MKVEKEARGETFFSLSGCIIGKACVNNVLLCKKYNYKAFNTFITSEGSKRFV